MQFTVWVQHHNIGGMTGVGDPEIRTLDGAREFVAMHLAEGDNVHMDTTFARDELVTMEPGDIRECAGTFKTVYVRRQS